MCCMIVELESCLIYHNGKLNLSFTIGPDTMR